MRINDLHYMTNQAKKWSYYKSYDCSMEIDECQESLVDMLCIVKSDIVMWRLGHFTHEPRAMIM